MFERYTEQARRAIFFARFEAIHQGTKVISTAHILAGLDWEEDSRANAVGRLKENAAKLRSLVGIPYRPSTSTPYTEKLDIPLDREAKMALAYAAQEADADQQYWLDTDYLLRGLLRFQNRASAALHAIQLDLESVRIASERHRAVVPPAPDPPAHQWDKLPNKKDVVTAKGIVIAVMVGLVMVVMLYLLSRWIR